MATNGFEDPLVERFLAQYHENSAYYQRIVRLAQYTYYGKSPPRLRKKIYERLRKAPGRYKTEEDIKEDIVDLAGARIALYLPTHWKEVMRVIKDNFKGVIPKDHAGKHITAEAEAVNEDEEQPYIARFRGYFAHHCRVKLNEGLA
ncbi:hypothetical protein GQ43DRAFT_468872 [Delitschia confertaspora ATCC 74209]|uniref:Uncharacterized protein n=1 Tax=Delitschia confertaspora ATCC 74209 TaxID=1513339 RepID=A0A9P4JT35_9PLEO|nr:hypothetical protein GQ43DRAFT_468872 [Delitschia confertaspora ATCC 74209]